MRGILAAILALIALWAPARAQEIRVTELPQQRLSVAPGEYSGITYLSGNRYAVVDDDLSGGGIVFFDIPVRADGRVRTARVRRTVPAGTASASVTGLDNEGVVFTGSSLYVSAEHDQSVREYDLDGFPTGRVLAVPADMDAKSIERNGGFEPLAFNSATGLFWTTTEFPLKRDTAPSRLHRLQSFDTTGTAGARFLYQTDEPAVTAAVASAAWAYVFGIPALTALPDGRLIVLEREVYVPHGKPKEILGAMFSRVKLYLVNPSGDPGAILPKQLLCSFETGIRVTAAGIDVTLANYEGMCLGPVLPDGRRTLILIADSQGGMSRLADKLGRRRLTNEFVKVLLLEIP